MCPVFYDYIPVCEILIQVITVFKRYCPETIFNTEIKGHNSDNNRSILSIIELDLYCMIIYLCMKYESNSPMYSKDIVPYLCMKYESNSPMYSKDIVPNHSEIKGHNSDNNLGILSVIELDLNFIIICLCIK